LIRNPKHCLRITIITIIITIIIITMITIIIITIIITIIFIIKNFIKPLRGPEGPTYFAPPGLARLDDRQPHAVGPRVVVAWAPPV